ncbi:hypothetical protein DFQ28_002137 [Apophysomyces sp. BC1034]|nr:hypothetical protein DFQ28_002137 [Apophysomyces sp. BC1034]
MSKMPNFDTTYEQNAAKDRPMSCVRESDDEQQNDLNEWSEIFRKSPESDIYSQRLERCDSSGSESLKILVVGDDDTLLYKNSDNTAHISKGTNLEPLPIPYRPETHPRLEAGYSACSLEATRSSREETLLYGTSAPALCYSSNWTQNTAKERDLESEDVDLNSSASVSPVQVPSEESLGTSDESYLPHSARRHSASSSDSIFVYSQLSATMDHDELKKESSDIHSSTTLTDSIAHQPVDSDQQCNYYKCWHTEEEARVNPTGSKEHIGCIKCLGWKQAALDFFRDASKAQLTSSHVLSATEAAKKYRSSINRKNKGEDRLPVVCNADPPIDTLLTASMWVGYFKGSVSFKDVQQFFYNVDVLHIQYRRREHYACLTYRNREAMKESIKQFNNTVFYGSVLKCWPVVEEDYKDICKQQMTFVWRNWLTEKGNAAGVPQYMGPSEYYDTSLTAEHGYHPYMIQAPGGYFTSESYLFDHSWYNSSLLPHDRQLTWSTATSFPGTQIPDARYIVLKPWASEDVERSYNIGYWSVPRSKVEYLNGAAAEVYLIFSITGSGGFHGYAR